MAIVKHHWSKGANAASIRAQLSEKHWARGSKASEVRERLSQIGQKRLVSPSSMERLRAGLFTGKRHSEATRAKLSKPKLEPVKVRMRAAHASRSPRREEWLQNIRNSHTPEFRRHAAELVRQGVTGYRLAKNGYYTCNRGRCFHMRSTWEVAVAGWLDAKAYDWDYEPYALTLLDGSVYLPDFVLADGRVLEVKGYLDARDEWRLTLVRAAGHRVLLLNYRFLRRLGLLREKSKV